MRQGIPAACNSKASTRPPIPAPMMVTRGGVMVGSLGVRSRCSAVVHVEAVRQDLDFRRFVDRDVPVAAPEATLFEAAEGHRHIRGANTVDIDENRAGLDAPGHCESVRAVL